MIRSSIRSEIRELHRITQRRRMLQGRSVRAFDPLAREDRQLFEALSSGEHHIRGFTNQDLRAKLLETSFSILWLRQRNNSPARSRA